MGVMVCQGEKARTVKSLRQSRVQASILLDVVIALLILAIGVSAAFFSYAQLQTNALKVQQQVISQENPLFEYY